MEHRHAYLFIKENKTSISLWFTVGFMVSEGCVSLTQSWPGALECFLALPVISHWTHLAPFPTPETNHPQLLPQLNGVSELVKTI